MQNENQIIEQLAAKLGVTSESIWKALLTQARIESYWFLIVTLLLVIAFILLLKAAIRGKNKTETWESFECMAPIGVAFIVGTFLFVMLLTLPSETAGLYNPEAAAIKSLFKE